MNALQRGNHRKVIATVKTACNTFFMQRVEDGSVPKRESSKSLPVCDFGDAGAVIESARRRGVDEHAVRPCGAGHGSMPIVADHEFGRECVHYWKLRRRIAIHKHTRIRCPVAVCIGSYVPAVVDDGIGSTRKIRGSLPAQLQQHVRKFVTRISRHSVRGSWWNRKG